jgi:hypothetical protein
MKWLSFAHVSIFFRARVSRGQARIGIDGDERLRVAVVELLATEGKPTVVTVHAFRFKKRVLPDSAGYRCGFIGYFFYCGGGSLNRICAQRGMEILTNCMENALNNGFPA